MLFRIALQVGWIILALGLYVVVAKRCARLPHHPFGVRLYRLARGTVSRPHRHGWYVALFVGCLGLLTGGIYAGVEVVNQTDHWQLIGACLAVVAAGYSTFVLWPHRSGETRDWVVPFVLSVTVAWVFASMFVWLPGWAVNHVGGLILAVPVFIWFRSLKVRTTACFLLAFAVHDGIHVFLTGKMDEFMAPFAHTPFILYLPRDATLSTLSSVGHGDLVVPGILVVVAGRMAARTDQPWLLWGTCLGVVLGFTASFVWTNVLGGSFPMLVTLVPGGLMGYALGSLIRRASPIRTDPPTSEPAPAAALDQPETF